MALTSETVFLGGGKQSHLLNEQRDHTLCGRDANVGNVTGHSAGEPGCNRCHRIMREIERQQSADAVVQS